MKYCSPIFYLEYLASVRLMFSKVSFSSWGIRGVQILKTGHKELGTHRFNIKTILAFLLFSCFLELNYFYLNCFKCEVEEKNPFMSNIHT